MSKIKKMSFFASTPLSCPVCNTKTMRETMLTGRGRLNALSITRELRREYQKTQDYGLISPMIYTMVVCPKCLTSLMLEDFERADYPLEVKTSLLKQHAGNVQAIHKLLGDGINFLDNRCILSGAASYLLGFSNYSKLPLKYNSDFKSALCLLRLHWLLEDIKKEQEKPSEYLVNFSNTLTPSLAKAIEKAYNNILDNNSQPPKYFGPDTDFNYGFDGFSYLYCYFKFKSLHNASTEEKKALYTELKTNMSKMFGLGHTSKDKPGILMKYIRELYSEVSSSAKLL